MVSIKPGDEDGLERATLLVGGFGALRGSSCPGIERVELRVRTDADGVVGPVSLSKEGVLADVPSPTWLTRDGDRLYAMLEDTNEIALFRIESDEGVTCLALLSRVPTPGTWPTHAAVVVDDLGGRNLVVANYADGHVCVHPIASDGTLSEASQMLAGEGRGPLPAQEGPHAHWILPLPDGRVLSTDLGADRIHVHRWESGRLVRVGSVELDAGTGPRDMHLLPVAGDQDGQWRVAVVGEWGGTVTVLGPASSREDGSDGIRVLQTVDLGADDLDQAASLAFIPWTTLRHEDTGVASESGMAYVGLRGSERIVALEWDGGRLSRLAAVEEPGWRGRGVDCGGSRPRHILPIGDLLLVANEVSNNLTVFRITPDGEPVHVIDYPSGSPTVSVLL